MLIKTEMALNVWSGTCTWLRQMDTLWCQQRVQFMTAQTIKNSNDSSTPLNTQQRLSLLHAPLMFHRIDLKVWLSSRASVHQTTSWKCLFVVRSDSSFLVVQCSYLSSIIALLFAVWISGPGHASRARAIHLCYQGKCPFVVRSDSSYMPSNALVYRSSMLL